MRTLILFTLALPLLAGCTNQGAQHRALDDAYEAYAVGDCGQVMLSLSQAERYLRPTSLMHAEISLMRGQCLERQGLFPDAVRTYEFILKNYPNNEYAFRAKARLETLQQLGYYQPIGGPAIIKVPPASNAFQINPSTPVAPKEPAKSKE